LALSKKQVHSVRVNRKVRLCVRADVYSVCPSILSSAVAFTTCYPIDTYKIKLQNGRAKDIPPSYLVKGYREGLALCTFITMVYFGSLQFLMTHMAFTRACFFASFITTLVKVPCKSLTKVLQNGTYGNVGDIAKDIWKRYGIVGFYRGFWVYVLDDVPDAVVKFHLYSKLSQMTDNTILVGAITGIVTTILTQPSDMLKTIIICNVEGKPINFAKLNYFKGLHLSILINSMQSAIFFYTYNIIKHLF
jgi:hypothetical protein